MNIYKLKEFNKEKYAWNPRARKLAVWNRVLQYVIWILTVLFLAWVLWEWIFRQAGTWALQPGGFLIVFLSIIVLNLGMRTALAGFFHNLSRRLYPSARHDFALYEYHLLRGRVPAEGARLLLLMAQTDLMRGEEQLAYCALREVDVSRLKPDQMKLYDFLQLVTCLLGGNTADSEQTESSNQTEKEREKAETADVWYARYEGIPRREEIRFPDYEATDRWIQSVSDNGKADESLAEEMRKAVQETAKGKEREPLSALIFTLLLFHVIFYFAVWALPGNGWQLRPAYKEIGGNLAALFLIVIGFWLMYLYWTFWRRQNPYPEIVDKIGAGILIAAGSIFVLLFSGFWWLYQMVAEVSPSDMTERVLATDVRDSWSGTLYDYLAIDTYNEYQFEWGTKYFRASDFMLMEEWDEAKYSDPEWNSSAVRGTGIKGSGGYTVSSSDEAPSQTAESTEGSSDGNSGSEDLSARIEQYMPEVTDLYQAVYEYLKDNNETDMPDSALNDAIQYDMNARAEPYAVIGAIRGAEFRLYDNGMKTAEDGTEQEEIVLEKVYTDGGSDTQLYGFYLVDPDTLEVTDEHKTSW